MDLSKYLYEYPMLLAKPKAYGLQSQIENRGLKLVTLQRISMTSRQTTKGKNEIFIRLSPVVCTIECKHLCLG